MSSRFLASIVLLVAATAFAEERDVFDYAGQRAAGDDLVKIVFIGDAGTHGPPGNHEFVGGSLYMARALNAAYPNVFATVRSSKNWPEEADLKGADAIVVGLNHGERAATDPNIAAAVRKGAGFMAIHFGVEVNKGVAGRNYVEWMGGYFETFWSVNPWWSPKFDKFPEHAITRGVKPFSVNDEWYYHMRFADDMKGVTPILSAVPPLTTVRKEPSDRGGNADVFAEVEAGKPQHVAWAYERPGGGRGFGFTGMHKHDNWADDGFRLILLNGAAWVAGLDVPEAGVKSKTLEKGDVEKLIVEAKQAIEAGK